MSLTIADQYYLKAVDFYPYDLEQATEALNFALSYDNEHCQANCLMGRLHMEVLKNFDTAEQYFEAAIVSNLQYVDTYKYFSLLKIWKGEFSQAMRIIEYGLKVKGMDIACLIQRKALIYEAKGFLELSKSHIEVAMASSVKEEYVSFFENEITRLKKKIKKSKHRKVLVI